ncbi:MAG: 2-C-methyl-D-erythritol 4-phosphate cytidylyltransferase, partial [Rhodocyclaceae bacterium]|nr:2-C-methyl-D-erythritol 4-phosphate cytidylyltransferase [Rhodocyclaceae bacterium]
MSIYALVPAAGGGARMGGDTPKQYLPLAGVPLIRHALQTLAAVPAIERVFVVLARADGYWDRYDWQDLAGRLTVLRCGGAERADTVAAGLRELREQLHDDDWVLVHDAARACLTRALVEKLIAEVGDDPVSYTHLRAH